MGREILLVLPNQLFEAVFTHPDKTIILIEHPAYFRDTAHDVLYHKQKLIMHRASMQAFYERLEAKGMRCCYVDYHLACKKTLRRLFEAAPAVYIYDPVDQARTRELEQLSVETDTPLQVIESPNFLTERHVFTSFFHNKKRYFMADFYAFQRRRLDIMMVGVNPEGGRYSFDTENRRKLPAGYTVPKPLVFEQDARILAAMAYVEAHFPDHPGQAETFNHPVTREQALALLDYFMRHQLNDFGPYQDALSTSHDSVFHSKLSAPLNIGLLSPREIVDAVLEAPVVLSSKEGFIRQIIGWREFMRAMYVLKGDWMRKQNYLHHNRPLHRGFYGEGVGVEALDLVIEKIHRTAYAHHIERLMVLGNFMLLVRTDPDAIHRFFMTMFIDAYDWVMVPNIYGMSQFASGPLLTTKPYFSGAHYLSKMGYDPAGEWMSLWNALFYLFLRDHKAVIAANPRLKVLLQHLNRHDDAAMRRFEQIAAPWLTT